MVALTWDSVTLMSKLRYGGHDNAIRGLRKQMQRIKLKKTHANRTPDNILALGTPVPPGATCLQNWFGAFASIAVPVVGLYLPEVRP